MTDYDVIRDAINYQDEILRQLENKDGQIISNVVDIREDEFVDTLDSMLDVEDAEDFYELDGEGKIKPNILQLTHGWKNSLIENRAVVCINSSMKVNGMGKSHLSFWEILALTDRWAFKYKKPSEIPLERLKFNFNDNFFFIGSYEDMIKKTNKLPVGSAICVDEMLGMAYKRRAMSSNVLDLNEWLGMKQRKTRVALIGNMPDFWDLDAYQRCGKANYYVECLERGWGIEFKADYFPHTDPWHQEELERISKNRRRGYSESVLNKIRLLRRHPCFKRVVNWCAMPKELERQYDKMVLENEKVDRFIDTKEEFDKWKHQFLAEHNAETFKIHKAIVNLVDMLQIRGAKISPLLRSSGITKTEYERWVKEVRSVEGTYLDNIIKKEIQQNNPQQPETTAEQNQTQPETQNKSYENKDEDDGEMFLNE